MTNPIQGIGNLQSLLSQSNSITQSQSDPSGLSFQHLLMDSLNQINSMELESQQAIEKGVFGGELTQVEVFSAVKKADLALKMMMQVRNKLLEAYNEVKQMRMG